MDARPIGIFDSGLGGLTVVKEIKKILPSEQIIYLGDTARVPYGTRSKETVVRFSLQNTKFLSKFNIKCLVIACNTASALAYGEIKNSVSVPIIDVINPGAETALSKSSNKIIGVIGTRGTILSHAYKNALKKRCGKVIVYEQPCPLFVPLIEEGEVSGELIKIAVKKYLKVFIKTKIDTLILGCTHYPIVSGVIQKNMGDKVILVNSGVEAAKKLYDTLKNCYLLAEKKGKDDKYFVTDLSTSFIYVAEKYLGQKISSKVKKVSLN